MGINNNGNLGNNGGNGGNNFIANMRHAVQSAGWSDTTRTAATGLFSVTTVLGAYVALDGVRGLLGRNVEPISTCEAMRQICSGVLFMVTGVIGLMIVEEDDGTLGHRHATEL